MNSFSGIVEDVKQFCWKHRAKIGVGAVCIAGGAAVYYYYTHKETLTDNSEEEQERSKDAEGAKIDAEGTRMLVAVNELYGFAIIYFTPTIRGRVKEVIDVSETIRRLKELKSDHSEESRDEKVTLWDDIKLSAFSSLLTTVYSLSTASVLLRVQMHILVRDAARVGESDQPEEDIFKALLEGTYETFFGPGMERLANLAKTAVESTVSEWSVESKLSVDFEEVCDALRAMRGRLEEDQQNIVNILLLPRIDVNGDIPEAAESTGNIVDQNCSPAETDIVNTLFSQTWQVVQSVAFRSALAESFDLAFGIVLDHLRDTAFCAADSPSALRTLPLASLLPKIKTVTARLIPERIEHNPAAVEAIKSITAGTRVGELCHRVYYSPEAVCTLTPSPSYSHSQPGDA